MRASPRFVVVVAAVLACGPPTAPTPVPPVPVPPVVVPPPAPEPEPEPEPLRFKLHSDVARAVLTVTNEYRAAGGTCAGEPMPAVRVVAWETRLGGAAERHARDLAEHDESATPAPTARRRASALGTLGIAVRWGRT